MKILLDNWGVKIIRYYFLFRKFLSHLVLNNKPKQVRSSPFVTVIKKPHFVVNAIYSFHI